MKDRPTDYVIPDLDSYIMDEEEKAKQAELSLNEQLMEKVSEPASSSLSRSSVGSRINAAAGCNDG